MSRVVFTPSASIPAPTVTVQTSSPNASNFNMPLGSGNNDDTLITVGEGCTAYIAFGPNAAVGPSCPGCLVVQGGTSALLTLDPALSAGRPLATCVGGPGDPYGAIAAAAQGAVAAVSSPMAVAARQASAGASTGQFSALTIPAGGVITLTRGTASAQTTF